MQKYEKIKQVFKPEGPRRGDRPSPPSTGIPLGLWKRIGITLSVPVALELASRIRMPGVQFDPLNEGFYGDALSVMSLGTEPLLTAYLLVEITAALVPRLRPLRIGGPSGRKRLDRAVILSALVLALVQSFGVIAAIRSFASIGVGLRPTLPVSTDLSLTLPAIVPMLSLVGGTGIFIVLSRIVNRYGLGNGVAVLLLYEFGVRSYHAAGCIMDNRGMLNSDGTDGNALFAFFLIIALSAATYRLLKTDWKNETLPRKADIISGLFLLTLVINWGAQTDELSRLVDWPLWIRTAALLSAAWLSGYLSKRLALHSGRITSVFERCGEDPVRISKAITSAPETSRAALLRSAAYLAFLAFTWYWIDRRGGCIGRLVANDFCFLLIVSTAVVLDIIRDFKSHQKEGTLQSVWPIERLYVVGPSLRMLERRGIEAYVKNAHTKTLLQFVGPFVPIELMVCAKDCERAQTLLHDALIQDKCIDTQVR